MESELEIGTMGVSQDTRAQDLVIYHGPGCLDGFVSAYICWRFYQVILTRRSVQFLPMQYDEKLDLSLVQDREQVLIVDFSFDRSTLATIASVANFVTVLDHHKGAKEALENWEGQPANLEITFNMEKSGAGLTWEYFHPGVIPEDYVVYTEDRDLWKWKYPETKNFTLALMAYQDINSRHANFEEFFGLLTDMDSTQLVKAGKAIQMYYNQQLETVLKNASSVLTRFGVVSTLNANYLFASEAGNVLAKWNDSKLAMVYSIEGGNVRVSMRSVEGAAVTAQEFAKFYGGNGHEHAAGFKMELHEFISRFLS